MHQIRLRSFDCCLPLCFRSSMSLEVLMPYVDPFQPPMHASNTRMTAAENAVYKATLGLPYLQRIDVPGEVL